MNTEDIVIVICLNKADAEAEMIKWQTALTGQAVDIKCREVTGLPIMSPVTCGTKPVVYSARLSDALESAWVVTLERR